MWVEKRHHAFIKSQASTKDYAKSSSNPIRGGKYLLDHLIHFPANARLFLRVNLLVCLPPAPCVTVGLSFCLWAVTGTWTIFLVFQNRGFSFYLVLAYEKKNKKSTNQPKNKTSNQTNKTKQKKIFFPFAFLPHHDGVLAEGKVTALLCVCGQIREYGEKSQTEESCKGWLQLLLVSASKTSCPAHSGASDCTKEASVARGISECLGCSC